MRIILDDNGFVIENGNYEWGVCFNPLEDEPEEIKWKQQL